MIKKNKILKKKFNKGDFVVYPSYGLGKITGIKNEIFSGKRIKVYIISISERVVLRVPAEKIKNLGLRICFPNGIRADRPKNHKNSTIMFKAMRDAGVVSITVTPEHGDQDFLHEVIGKRMDLSDVLSTIQMAHDNEMLVHAAFMMGFPL